MKVANPKHPAHKAETKKKTHVAEHPVFAAQLAHAQALPALPSLHTTPPKTHSHKPVPRAEAADASRNNLHSLERPRDEHLVRAPQTEPSAHAEAAFSMLEPGASEAPKIDAPPPTWAPLEVALDETARMAIFPNSVQFVNEGQAMSLLVKNGEVSIRAAGELAASLRSSENELRIALAQEGLKLRETDSTTQQRNDDATSDDRRRQHEERPDEWT